MQACTLVLRDFRVHASLELTLDGHAALVGPNGVGKTSVLEALHLLSVGRSFRRVPDHQLVRHGAGVMEAMGTLVWGDLPHRVACRVVPEGGKRIEVDGRVLDRVGELVEATSVVVTSAEDVQLVEGSPEHVRRWLDLFGCQRQRGVLALLVRYAQVLRQRNALLAKVRAGMSGSWHEALHPWSLQLFELGVEIEATRLRLVRALEGKVAEVFEKVAESRGRVELRYRPGVRSDSLEGLEGLLPREVARGHTLWGPHRASLEVVLDGVAARSYASRGEKRSIAFALKIAQATLMPEAPLCLLDDVALELDPARSARVVELFMGVGQVIATSARPDPLPEGLTVHALRGR